MAQFNNAMEIFKLLPKTNCKKCEKPTCLAFAGAVFTSTAQLSSCPYISEEQLEEFGSHKKTANPIEEQFDVVMKRLQDGLLSLDLQERAATIGGEYKDDSIILPILGKPLRVDQQSNVTTDLHVNGWVLGTALHYINYSKGVPLHNNWVPLRELPGGKDWYRLFGQQCEKVLKTTADKYPDLFSDLVEMFKGKQVDEQFQSDVAVILSPLPLVPMLICYWLPEDGMESSLNLFFDDTAEDNIGMDGLYTLGVGIAKMLEKLTLVHGN